VLTRLHIRNLAVLDEIELELDGGFSALTGETGAGKSMLVDALALCLGERAETSAVRAGASRAEVTAVFDLRERGATSTWLAARDLDAGAECQVRRVVTSEGRSRAYVNGQPVPLETLRDLGEQLVEICGQHAHQSLLRPATQREILDAHGGHAGLLAEAGRAHAAWSELRAERLRLEGARDERRARADLLEYQIRELSALNLREGEYEQLEQERRLLANAGRLSDGLRGVLERLHDAETYSARDIIGAARREIGLLRAIDPGLGAAAEALETAEINIAEAADQVRHRLDGLEHDPARQDAVESRLASIDEIARKHRTPPQRLWETLRAFEAELEGLSARDSRLREIEAESSRLADALHRAAAALSKARAEAASTLAAAAGGNLRSLGMPDASLVVRVTPLPAGEINASGADQVEFLVSTNAGQPPGPIAKVASGGELSRLSLAIEVVCVAGRNAPTLVFDEVDAGVGGSVAEMVGQCLRRLSGQRQVLCVTHLAQVASQADHHFAVSKATAGDTTRTAVRELATTERVEEIARMLGGIRITERTRAHAREMLQSGRTRRAG
jgi:DNA repair protein RecN (Recombination protein N)